MAKRQSLRTVKGRRRRNQTDYKARLNLLKSGLPRIVIRKTNKYVFIQYVETNEAKDKVIISISSKELLKHGWEKEKAGSLKSIPACYLTGFLFGKKIKDKEVIVDIGLIKDVKKNRIYAVLKGLIDSGVNIKHDEEKELFPDEKRLKGEHLKNKIDFEKIKGSLK